MSYTISCTTMKGRRKTNQDAALVGGQLLTDNAAFHSAADPAEPLLLGVADGIGGGQSGAQAARSALETLQGVFDASAGNGATPCEQLVQAACAANEQVYGLCVGSGGCTLSCAVLGPEGDFVTLGLGDSPVWLLTPGGSRRLFVPQNMAELLRAEGKHPKRAQACELMAFCGESFLAEDLPFRLTTGKLQPGWGLLLHSDGLTLPPRQLQRQILQKRKSAKALCTEALLRGSSDNITCLYAVMEPNPEKE